MTNMIPALRASLILLLLFTALLGGVYPLTVTAFAQLFFHDKASGSLVIKGDRVVGSRLIGQQFTETRYFWGRLSATTPPYNAMASGGSNFNPANEKFLSAAKARISALKRADSGNPSPIPIDLITASASGLDPHISLAAAEYQISRVARARGMKEGALRVLVAEHAEYPMLGFIGEKRVNVLELNIALEQMAGGK